MIDPKLKMQEYADQLDNLTRTFQHTQLKARVMHQRLRDLEEKHAKERSALERAIFEESLAEYRQFCSDPNTDHILVAIPRLTEKQIEVLRFLSTPRHHNEWRDFLLFGYPGRPECRPMPPELRDLRDMIEADQFTFEPEIRLTLLGKAALKHYTDE